MTRRISAEGLAASPIPKEHDMKSMTPPGRAALEHDEGGHVLRAYRRGDFASWSSASCIEIPCRLAR